MKDSKEFTKNAGKTACGTMLSRILGYLRDMLVANLFGAGMFSDAFYAAFRIPNLLRRLLGEGSFSAAFIPVFSQYLHTQEKSETQKLLNVVFSVLLVVLLLVSALGMFFAPILVKIIAWGFTNDPQKLQLTIELTRLMFPFVVFICLAAFLLAVLNTLKSFFIPAFAPSALSFSEIVYVLAFAPLFSPENQIKGLAISVIFGGLLHFAIQYPKLKSLGWNLKFKFTLNHPGLKKIFLLMIPSVIGISVDQINAFVDTICASILSEGSVTALYYSNRVMQLPLALFGLAFASVSLPALSKAFAQHDMETFKDSLNFSIRTTYFAIIPAALGLMVIGLPIVQLLFEHGKFDLNASLMTNSALFFYATGLPAYALTKIFANAFYSCQDTKTPVIIAAFVMAIHALLCFALMYVLGVGGLALATSISAYINLFGLIYFLRLKVGNLGIRNFISSSIKSTISAVITGLAAFFAIKVSSNVFISVPCAIGCAVIVFIVSSKILKSEEFLVFASLLSKTKQ